MSGITGVGVGNKRDMCQGQPGQVSEITGTISGTNVGITGAGVGDKRVRCQG